MKIALRPPLRADLDEILIALIRFCQKDQMPQLLLLALHPLKAALPRDVDLASDDRLDALRAGFFIKIDTAEHDAVIGDRGAVHAKLLDSGNVLFDLVRSVQKAVFGMYM